MKRYHINVRRDRPSGVSLAIALAITMLIVYLMTLDSGRSVVVESVSAAPRVTREITMEIQKLYLISLCSGDSPEDARIQAAGFTARGAAGYIHEWEEKWHVLGAAYASEKDARRIVSKLREKDAPQAQEIKIQAEEVRMRITAPESRIEAIAAADILLRSQTQQLGELALQLDRGDIRPAAVYTLCDLAATEAADAAKALEEIPGAPENKLCADLIGLLKKLNGLMKALVQTAQNTSADLSGMLRCAQIENYIGHCGLQAGLGEKK